MDDSLRYTRTAMLLHWLVAGLMLVNVVLGLSADSLPDAWVRPVIASRLRGERTDEIGAILTVGHRRSTTKAASRCRAWSRSVATWIASRGLR